MKEQIKAIFFDMGGTLRTTNMSKREVDTEKIHEMIVLLGMEVGEGELIELLQEHARAYRDWAKKNLLDLNEVELWTRWMLPDWPSDQVSRHGLQLNQLWRAGPGSTTREAGITPAATSPSLMAMLNTGNGAAPLS